jgi:hypothetical protein
MDPGGVQVCPGAAGMVQPALEKLPAFTESRVNTTPGIAEIVKKVEMLCGPGEPVKSAIVAAPLAPEKLPVDPGPTSTIPVGSARGKKLTVPPTIFKLTVWMLSDPCKVAPEDGKATIPKLAMKISTNVRIDILRVSKSSDSEIGYTGRLVGSNFFGNRDQKFP